jgi:hypothetical protein
MRLFARIYFTLVTLAVCWAWWIDITMQSVVTEHQLPNFVLMYLTLPTSFGFEILFIFLLKVFPWVEHSLYVQLTFMTLGAYLQVFLIILCNKKKKRSS